MKNYVKPVAIAAEEMFEGVYAASGEDGGITVTVRWGGHDSGSHSDGDIMIYKPQGVRVTNIHITLTFCGYCYIDGLQTPCNIAGISQLNNCDNYTWNGNTIEIYKSATGNEGAENWNIGFSMSFNPSPNPGYAGSGAYWPTGTHQNEITYVFTASVIAS